MEYVLAVNVGSSSYKFGVFREKSDVLKEGPAALELVAKGNIQKVHIAGDSPYSLEINGKKEEGIQQIGSHGEAINFSSGWLSRRIDGFKPDAIGYKWVYAGEENNGTHFLYIPGEGETKVVERTREFERSFPRHDPYYLAALMAFKGVYPDVPGVGPMERSFHYSIPLEARARGVPLAITDEYENPLGIGFHSASLRSALYNASRELETPTNDLSMIIMHLGGTGTVSAVRNGESVDTSLQFVANGGTIHNTAFGGAVDPELVLKLIDAGKTTDELRDLLALQGGLQGISGIKGGDMKEILERAEAGDNRAILAREAFIYGAKSLFGAYAYAALRGNIDAVVFSGGIGEKSPYIRERILEDAEIFGFNVDGAANSNNSRRINSQDSMPILVLPTDEELIVAFYTAVATKLGRDIEAREMTKFLKR